MSLKCNKCGNRRLTNPSTNYTYYCDKDRLYFKVCPFCNGRIEDKDICDCPHCGEWLPNFPTSWVRSATNIYILRKVAEFISVFLNGNCTDSDLSRVLTRENLVTVSQKRLENNREEYWKGGPQRRASEYAVNLRYLGFASKKSYKTYLNYFGNVFTKVETKLDFNSCCIRSFLRLKLGNVHDSKGTYSQYRIRPLFLILKLIGDLEKSKKVAYLENIALAVMCRDEEDDYSKALNYSKEYDRQFIYDTFFSKGKEYKRVVLGVFVHWLEQIGLINKKSSTNLVELSLTPVGKEILDTYRKIDILSGYNKDEIVENIEKSVDGVPIIDFEYDVLNSENRKYVYKKTGKTEKYYLNAYNKLLLSELDKIKKIVVSFSSKKERELLELKVSKISEETQRTGQKWESYVYDCFDKLSLKPLWYRYERTFASVILPDEAMDSLAGGTEHNPDIIILEPLLLIDPKKNANNEMYKVSAYDLYALHPEIDGNSLIASQVVLKENYARRIEGLKRTSVIDKYALDTLIKNKDFFKTELVFKLFGVGLDHGHYIDEEALFDFAKEKGILCKKK